FAYFRYFQIEILYKSKHTRMQKLKLLILFFIGFTTLSIAQDLADHSLGIRVGDNNGLGMEVTYQHLLEENKRLEAGLAWHKGTHLNSYKLTALHQWVWVLEDNINWYAGAGSGIGRLRFDANYKYLNESKSNTFIFVVGNIGLE